MTIESDVNGHSVTSAFALAKARTRRQRLDRERDVRDRQIEEAAAVAIETLNRKTIAEQAVESSVSEVRHALDEASTAEHELDEATGEFAGALHDLLDAPVTPERAAALLDVSVADVQRLAHSEPDPRQDPTGETEQSERPSADPSLPAEVGVFVD
jgi:hypothetical protein